mmetsp:Transcript_5170/g.8010  ORF Transcript_5170/g.8010 Transcript_5170/m.8010 type:complete len:97 (-) Transcript_5170:161-451(-)
MMKLVMISLMWMMVVSQALPTQPRHPQHHQHEKPLLNQLDFPLHLHRTVPNAIIGLECISNGPESPCPGKCKGYFWNVCDVNNEFVNAPAVKLLCA